MHKEQAAIARVARKSKVIFDFCGMSPLQGSGKRLDFATYARRDDEFWAERSPGGPIPYLRGESRLGLVGQSVMDRGGS